MPRTRTPGTATSCTAVRRWRRRSRPARSPWRSRPLPRGRPTTCRPRSDPRQRTSVHRGKIRIGERDRSTCSRSPLRRRGRSARPRSPAHVHVSGVVPVGGGWTYRLDVSAADLGVPIAASIILDGECQFFFPGQPVVAGSRCRAPRPGGRSDRIQHVHGRRGVRLRATGDAPRDADRRRHLPDPHLMRMSAPRTTAWVEVSSSICPPAPPETALRLFLRRLHLRCTSGTSTQFDQSVRHALAGAGDDPRPRW
jgi:hypothetical protein